MLVPPPGALSMRRSSVDQGEALPHSSEPEGWLTVFSGWIETNAIVAHGKLQTANDGAKLDVYRTGA